MTPNIRDLWQDLGGGPLHPSGNEFRGAAFWREGDNQNAVAIKPETNQFYDFTAGAGGGPWELAATARGITVPEAGRWIAEKYGTGEAQQHAQQQDRNNAQQQSDYSAIRVAELKEAPAWRVGFLEYADRRLVELKSQLEESYSNPQLDQKDIGERIHLLTAYEKKLKSLAPEGYAVAEEYRAHKRVDPEWSREILAEGRESVAQARQVSGYLVNRLEQAERRENGYGAG